MTETSTHDSDSKKSVSGSSDSATKGPIFQRRIEFHLARNPFNPYSSNSGSDFHMETLNPRPDSQRPASKAGGGGSASAAKKLDGGGELIEHGLDPELRFEITFRRIGAGLANLGNTCFLNSVLQCLTYTEPFAAYLQSGKHKSSCHTAGFCALCAIQNHVMSALQSTGKILSPLHLVKNLRCISRNFRNSRQEDAHEYMVNLLESMHKCCLPPGVSSESPSAYEKSLVHKIFGGSLRSQVKCMQCSYGSNKFDPFLDLSLEIVKADSLRKALAHFTAMEQLDGGQRQYQCQRCKVKVKALKQLTVHKAPYVLAIHLKRFGPDVPGQKIDKRVEFGPTLDLKPFVSGPYEGELKYTLYGVLVHAGWSTHSGHYYCFVRTSSGMWYSLDDRRVVQVSERTVLEQKAYMLFYVRDRRSTTLPKKPLNIVRNESATANATRNRELHISTTGLKSECQSSQLERSLDASKCAASLTKTKVSFVQPISAVDSSSKEPLVKEESGLQSGGQVTAQVVQQLTILKGPMPSQKSTSLKKSSLLEVENLPKTVSKTEKGSVSTSIKGHDATSSTEIQGPSKGSIFVVSQQSAGSGLQSPSSKKLLTENCILKGPMPSQKSTSLKKSSLLEVENLPKTVSETEKGSVSTSIKGHDATSSTEIQGPSKVSIVVVSQQSAGNGLQNPSSKKLLTENSMHENGNVMNDRGPSNSPCKKASDAEFMKIGVTMLLGQSGAANGCVHEKSIEQTSGLQNAVVLNEKEPLDSTCMEHKGDVIFPLKHKSKKPLKHPVMRSMPFGPRQLFLKSLCLRKKKKHKRRKHGLDIKKLHLKGTMEDSYDPGTSTSENVMMADFDFIPVQPKCRRHCSTFKKRHVHREVRTSISACKDNSFENKGKGSEESSQQIAVRATDELSEKSSSAAANQVDVQDKRASIQHGLKNTLTMSLKQPTVACWDDIGPSSSETLGLNDARNCNIGYVVDEWDEDYDRGKRKKIRKSSHSFGGLNPFQEIATKKAQIKKMKMTKDQTSDQISAGNLPFRI